MDILSIPRMAISSNYGWPILEREHPPLVRVLATVVLPLSLLPPLMLYYAGSQYGDEFVAGYGDRPWATIAVVFFAAEMLTLLAMGWLIRAVAVVQEVEISNHDAYLLASIAPVPLWLSALGLLVPSLAFNVVVSVLALAASCGLIYHGVYALCHMHEEVTAAAITQTVICAGLTAWVLLLVAISFM